MQAACDGADQEGLAQTGHADEETVTVGEEGDEELLDDLVLADDDPADFALHGFTTAGKQLRRGDVVEGLAGRYNGAWVLHGAMLTRCSGTVKAAGVTAQVGLLRWCAGMLGPTANLLLFPLAPPSP